MINPEYKDNAEYMKGYREFKKRDRRRNDLYIMPFEFRDSLAGEGFHDATLYEGSYADRVAHPRMIRF